MSNILAEIYKIKKDHSKGQGASGVVYVGVCVGLFTKKHLDTIGNAIYIYGYLLAKVTGWNSRYKLGAVLKGTPIKFARMQDETGIPERTIRRYINILEKFGYLICLRAPRGLRFYITNYKPAGKPRLKQGECPQLAVLKLSELASQGLLIGHLLADLEGINEHSINTGEASFKYEQALYLQPLADIYFLIERLFNERLGMAELRYLYRGNKHTRNFITTNDLLKAIARMSFAHERKKAEQERSGHKVVGITNIIAYLNSGLHGRHKYLLTGRVGEQPYINRIHTLHQKIKNEIEQFKNKMPDNTNE